MPKQLIQFAPWPTELEYLVKVFRYKPGWSFYLEQDMDRDYEPDDPNHERPPIGRGTTLRIISLTYNSYGKHDAEGNYIGEYSYNDPPDYRVAHYKIVPAATFTKEAWERWILDQCVEIETHEACEFARFVYDDGVDRPFAPLHGPGENPYVIHEFSTDEQRRTSFRGVVKEKE